MRPYADGEGKEVEGAQPCAPTEEGAMRRQLDKSGGVKWVVA